MCPARTTRSSPSATCPSAGYLLESENVAYLAPGRHTLRVRAALAALGGPSGSLLTVDVLDATTQQSLASLEVTAADFREARVFQGFSLAYAQDAADHPVQLRVRWNALAGAPGVTVSDVSIDGDEAFAAANLAHACGRFDGHFAWSADHFRDATACTLASGGAVRLDDGEYVAQVELRVDDFALDGAALAKLTVIDREENKVIASLDVKRSDFSNTAFRTFAVPFHTYSGNHYDISTEWLAAASAPRLVERAAYVRKAVSEVPVILPFNQRGLGAVPGDGAIDVAGSALSQPLLGAGRSFYAHSFTFGGGGNNVFQGGNTQVSVSAGKYASLDLVAFAVEGTQANQAFQLSYSDGSTGQVMQSVSDWVSFTPQPNERIALAMPYRWSKTAREYGNFHLFFYSLPVDPQKSLSAFALPNNANVKVLAATLVAAP